MISELHETLVDDIRFSFSDFMYLNGYDFPDVGFVAEACIANVLTGLVGIGLVAIGYIFSNDGYGVIPVEVGNMTAGKWSGITTSDEKPVRVFRVDFDRTLWMLNPRNTEFEGQLIQFYNARLSPS
jgi:hypothetical protein